MQSFQIPPLVRGSIRITIEKRIEALEKGYRQNIGLIGPEGLGKTHVLASVFQVLSGRPGFLPVYVQADALDFEHFADRWIGALLSGIFLSQGIQPPVTFQSLLLAADPLIPKTTDKIRHLKKAMRREKNAATVKELFALVNSLAQETGKSVIVMIDEFQCLEALPAPDPFVLLGREIMIEKNTLYLVSSSSPHKAREIFRDKLSMLFGNFEVLELAPFSFSESGEFLEKRLPHLHFSGAQKRLLIRLTDGKPLYLDLLAEQLEACLASHAASQTSLLKDQGNQVPTFCLLEAFYRELYPGKGRISLLFERRMNRCRNFSKDASAYLRTLLAMGGGRHRPVAIASFIEKKALETKKILQRLVQEDLIFKKGSFFVLGDPLFQFWLKEVYERRNHRYMPEDTAAAEGLLGSLNREFEKTEQQAELDLAAHIEMLFKEFRQDSFEIDGKKIDCPQFSEISFRPNAGSVLQLLAKNSKTRWFCQIAYEMVKEEDMAVFLEEIKKHRKGFNKKILIALNGVEQNAKLMAQEAGAQLWNLRTINTLLDLYDLPKMIPLSDKEEDEPSLGALAQSVHSA